MAGMRQGRRVHEHGRDIHVAELEAVVWMIRDVDQYCAQLGEPPPNFFVVAIDSMVAKGIILRRFAKKEKYQKVLTELFELLGNRKLALAYVDTKENPADAPSRDEDVDVQLWQILLPKLVFLGDEVEKKLYKSGRQTAQGGLRRERE